MFDKYFSHKLKLTKFLYENRENIKIIIIDTQNLHMFLLTIATAIMSSHLETRMSKQRSRGSRRLLGVYAIISKCQTVKRRTNN